jgi:hypothetical protein
MILKILGFLDILSALSFWLFYFFKLVPEKFILLIIFYLLAKGVFFLISKDIASILDVISAFIIFLALSFTLPAFLVILISLFLLQKGILSLLA